jgi:hypothetical protein
MPADPLPDINQTIIAAVNARVEAEVAGAMLSDETFAKFVTAALQQPIEVGGYSNKTKTTFLRHTMNGAIESATKAVVAAEIEAVKDQIKTEVRKALRASIGVIADSLVDGFVDSAAGRYPSIKVEFGDRA